MKRIAILDGLRMFAILFVMIGHFLAQYNVKGNVFLEYFIRYSFFGVPFFFVISGFVILYSLENTNNYLEFLKKRYLRLAPAMFICSCLTFCFFTFIYSGEGYGSSKYFPNLLIANTFIDPHVFDLFVGEIKFYYIDNAYWSLWVEVCFYVIIGFLFFNNKEKYIRNFTVICIIGILIFNILKSSAVHSYLKSYISEDTIHLMIAIAKCLGFFSECLWFLIGVFLYKLYKTPSHKKYIVYIVLSALAQVGLQKFDPIFTVLTIITVITYLVFVYKSHLLIYLTNPFIGKLGVTSYSVYLIHYHIGAGCIIMYNNYFGKESYLFLFLLVIFFFSFGLFSYNYLEKPLSNQLKKLLFNKKTGKAIQNVKAG
ncbi:Peptidoglycan/LPS O-acetylase OafA/YrhL, contains acyltransferase and SGNH-hydrolase domains [Chishuiella changwenlii]|uniref:Acyltransferase n=1 Tax=Chishuiella changwenlii TaxID=1434701 RepID=A0A1M7D757_9FLAO|nr:acyltransferase [Chishuiella changwenlii]GGF06935.1 acyltransferase [Chishuiella changwenlii]SHL75295.1 Peptidoglycan/LPS O-acetylase OafA/YrhL, contains acyltransferase and SGNH-hydrolase domains [Chishuiella changwenlii]